MFIAGVSLIVGLKNAGGFFFGRSDKLKGSAAFFGGVFIVLFGWCGRAVSLRALASASCGRRPVVGMVVEWLGLFWLFSGFLHRIVPFLRSVPVVSGIFYIPVVGPWLNSLGGSARDIPL